MDGRNRENNMVHSFGWVGNAKWVLSSEHLGAGKCCRTVQKQRKLGMLPLRLAGRGNAAGGTPSNLDPQSQIRTWIGWRRRREEALSSSIYYSYIYMSPMFKEYLFTRYQTWHLLSHFFATTTATCVASYRMILLVDGDLERSKSL